MRFDVFGMSLLVLSSTPALPKHPQQRTEGG
ncbi:MAG: hypothetical protein K0S45_4414 [Nitrospira sp.]|nr:hypothetical protein [Nitrospira sp.]